MGMRRDPSYSERSPPRARSRGDRYRVGAFQSARYSPSTSIFRKWIVPEALSRHTCASVSQRHDAVFSETIRDGRMLGDLLVGGLRPLPAVDEIEDWRPELSHRATQSVTSSGRAAASFCRCFSDGSMVMPRQTRQTEAWVTDSALWVRGADNPM